MNGEGAPPTHPAHRSITRTLGWAAYLGVSWTWCIGMFLPVLLVRDYGLWGFVVFAVPNVVGAAAMGWVLSRDGMSERLVSRHGPAMLAFSMVTVAFQAFAFFTLFTLQARPVLAESVWPLLQGRSESLLPIAVLAGLVVVAGVVVSVRGRWWTERGLLRVACVVLIGSLICAVLWLLLAGPVPLPQTARPSVGAAWMLPVCLLGFAFCPYLDLTFHKARSALTATAARGAFTLGFGVMFFAMILFTLGYASMLLTPASLGHVLGWVGLCAVVAHISMQLCATSMFHFDAAGRRGRLVAVGFILGGVAAGLSPQLRVSLGMTPEELLYRCFMVFYGLAFPAYVWLAMIPTRDGHAGIGGRRGRRKRLVLAGVVGLAMPMYWVGFIELNEPWLAGGAMVVVLGRLFVGGRLPREIEMSQTGGCVS